MSLQARLENLPVELISEIQLFALSPSLPRVSKRFYRIFKTSPASYHADYLLGQINIVTGQERPIGLSDILTKALRYPLCSKDVYDALLRRCGTTTVLAPDLPRRLFRCLTPRTTFGGRIAKWSESDHPLPFLRYLYSTPVVPDANSHDGYALIKAVRARFLPLVRFLLDHGASPALKNALAVMVAIHQNDLQVVRLLIERDVDVGRGKRRRLSDRVKVNADMLTAAVRCDAREIVAYLSKEKDCVPDLQTLRSLGHVNSWTASHQSSVSLQSRSLCHLP